MNATLNGRTYRVIYTAQGDLWARDVLLNPPAKQKRRKPAQLKKGTVYREVYEIIADTPSTAFEVFCELDGYSREYVSAVISRLLKTKKIRVCGKSPTCRGRKASIYEAADEVKQ